MKEKHYAREEALGLLPLLAAIGREIEERTNALKSIELELLVHGKSDDADTNPRVRELVARAATHRRELRLARAELDRLGCTVVGDAPLTFRIPGRDGSDKRSFVWQTGEAVPR